MMVNHVKLKKKKERKKKSSKRISILEEIDKQVFIYLQKKRFIQDERYNEC